MLTTQAQVRAAFWLDCGDMAGVSRKLIMNHQGTARNMHNTTTRCAFADYIDALARWGEISSKLAQRVTL